MRILLIEDEVPLTRKIISALIEAGHDAIAVHDAETALGKATLFYFDLIVLDVGLPGMDGFDLLRRLRAQHLKTRVLMLTSRSQLEDRLTGLQLGADDYLVKPFAMRELVARIGALGRRYPEEPALHLQIADLTLDLASHQVNRNGRQIDLSARESTLLRVLMREPGRIFTRTELCEKVWEHAHEYDTNLVEVFIGRLRKKLGEPSLIHTVRHVGYTIREPQK